MSAAVIWLDHDEAKIYRLKPGQVETEHLKNKQHLHHSGHDQDKARRDSNKFFHEVAKNLDGMSEILVMGPGQAKQEFVHHLEKHNHANLAQKIVGIESTDRLSENRILERARVFFKTYNVFYGT